MATTKAAKPKHPKAASQTQPVNINDLTSEQRKALLAEIKAQDEQEQSLIQEKRKGYKVKVNKTIPVLFKFLVDCNQQLFNAKKRIYEKVADLITEKSEVYDREQDQGSHTFTTDDGISITVGYRMLDGWDDTAEVGIQKVNDCIKTFGKDANSKALVNAVLKLLAKDGAGNLKASRVLQLKIMAEETKNKQFIDAIEIIQQAYRPTKSKQFITCRYKDGQGAFVDLPLSISDIDITEKNPS